MFGKKREHTALRKEMTGDRGDIPQIALRIRITLHTTIIAANHRNHRQYQSLSGTGLFSSLLGAEMHTLYSTKETGPEGPAAAIMRYLPGATAPAHIHPGYEIIFILHGELETDDGIYGPNSLLVMPPDSVHAPRSPRGCVGLVVWEQPVRVSDRAAD